MGRLSEDVKNRIKQLVKLGYKDHEIVNDIGVSRQTVAKYRLIVQEEVIIEKVEREEDERKRQEERDKAIREYPLKLARASALLQQEYADAEDDRLRGERVRENIALSIQQRRQDEEAASRFWNTVDEENQKIQTKKNLEFYTLYLQLFNLRLKSIKNGKHKEFMVLIDSSFGYPWNIFAFSEQELADLPAFLRDRPTMDLMLSMGLWPHKKDPWPIRPQNDDEIENPLEFAMYLSLFM